MFFFSPDYLRKFEEIPYSFDTFKFPQCSCLPNSTCLCTNDLNASLQEREFQPHFVLITANTHGGDIQTVSIYKYI